MHNDITDPTDDTLSLNGRNVARLTDDVRPIFIFVA